MKEHPQTCFHIKVNRKKTDKYASSIIAAVESHFGKSVQLQLIADFCCFNVDDCQAGCQIAQYYGQKQATPIVYTFISTDSVYDASHYLLDIHSH
jgi:hypothetical protein